MDSNQRTKTAQAAIRNLIEDMPEDRQNAYQVALKLDINSAHISKLFGGSLSPTLDRALTRAGALQPKPEPVPVEPCPNCGQAHTVDWCVHEEGQPKKPRSKKSKRKRKPRFSVAAYDVELAIGQLEKYYPEIDWRSALDGDRPVDSS